MLNISHTCDDDVWNAYVEENTCAFLRLGIQLNRAALRLHSGANPEISRHLSPREVEVMTLLARGQSRSQASQDLQISEHTLRVHIEAARKKMDASNTINAVARSIMMGYVVL
jgi:DNA-binding NarL/FixJ family response regulator